MAASLFRAALGNAVMWHVKRSDAFSAALQDFLPNNNLAQKFLKGVEWVLGKDPTSGARVNISGNVWFISSPSNVADIGDLSVYYVFDPRIREVILLSPASLCEA